MKLQTINELGISFIGPPLQEGPLPAFFYFAHSAQASLMQDPYNQPAAFLAEYPVRVFSLSLPFHYGAIPPTEALTFWPKKIS